MTFSILAARPDAVTWQMSSDHAVTVTMRHVAEAHADCILTGYGYLAGYHVDESTLIALADAMKQAAGLVRCDRCRQWTDLGDLCGECSS